MQQITPPKSYWLNLWGLFLSGMKSKMGLLEHQAAFLQWKFGVCAPILYSPTSALGFQDHLPMYVISLAIGRREWRNVQGWGRAVRVFDPEVVHSASAHIPLPRTQSHGHRYLQGKLGPVTCCALRKKKRVWSVSLTPIWRLAFPIVAKVEQTCPYWPTFHRVTLCKMNVLPNSFAKETTKLVIKRWINISETIIREGLGILHKAEGGKMLWYSGMGFSPHQNMAGHLFTQRNLSLFAFQIVWPKEEF